MAIYQKLLLSTGGGIVSSQQQADQEPNTATVIIGLGGTGVHCIRTIKSQVHMRLKPDDPKAIVPEYKHIRFIGVDTAEKSKGGALCEDQKDEEKKAGSILSLEKPEFYFIGNNRLGELFKNPTALKGHDEFDWLNYEEIGIPNLTEAGAGGKRQIGRLMMMDKSDDFMAKIQDEITKAKEGLHNPSVYIHIFSGLSGGTGSGCFLDVCYMVRHLASRIGGITIFGYFFLPDVNLSTIPLKNIDVRAYIPKNGYAAMQELDYCMGLPGNGGFFEQTYKGNEKIKWDKPPVDMCHLIGSTNKNGDIIPDAYNYAMNVAAEYIMDFLTASNSPFDLSQNLANFTAMVAQADNKKTFGSNMAYCTIGASCASIPLREINTYLASELFDKFGSVCAGIPTKADVEQLAISSIGKNISSISELYNSLLSEITEEAYPSEFTAYPNDPKFVLSFGNSELVTHYTDQKAAKLNKVEANKTSLITEKNEKSLISRLISRLSTIIKTPSKGAGFAYRMLSAAESHNLLNVIDGLLAENESRKGQEGNQSELRKNDYENAKNDFENRRKRSLLDNDQKRFQSYEFYLSLLEQHQLAMEIYKKLGDALTEFRKQVVEKTASHYIKLNRVMDTLFSTFKANKDALADQKTLQNLSSFAKPMMTIQELKPSLDKRIEELNIDGLMDQFMGLVLENEDNWIGEDEDKITAFVTRFFVETAFNDFATRTITEFLRDKYSFKEGGSTITNQQLTQYIYEDWIEKLTEKASPLFYYNSSIWPESSTSKYAILSFPTLSAPIQAAAAKMNSSDSLWNPKDSRLTDRIYAMCSAVALPLCTYSNCSEYEKEFYKAKEPGRHYYEGKKNPTIEFTDWNKLPSVTPQSIIHIEDAPLDLKKLISDARELFDKARKYHLIDDDSKIRTLGDKKIKEIKEACEKCEEKIKTVNKPQELALLTEAVETLRQIDVSETVETGAFFPMDGIRDTEEKIFKIMEDHFVYAPVIQLKISKEIDAIEKALSKKEELIKASEAKIQDIRLQGSAMTEYCEAIFTGIIKIEGKTVVYHKNNYGIAEDIILSKKGDDFKFGAIPVYQGFVSYKNLSAEIRSEIRKLSDEKMNSGDNDLMAVGKELKEILGSDRITAWIQLASELEQFQEIKEFIANLNKRFEAHCMENAIK